MFIRSTITRDNVSDNGRAREARKKVALPGALLETVLRFFVSATVLPIANAPIRPAHTVDKNAVRPRGTIKAWIEVTLHYLFPSSSEWTRASHAAVLPFVRRAVTSLHESPSKNLVSAPALIFARGTKVNLPLPPFPSSSEKNPAPPTRGSTIWSRVIPHRRRYPPYRASWPTAQPRRASVRRSSGRGW